MEKKTYQKPTFQSLSLEFEDVILASRIEGTNDIFDHFDEEM